MEQLFLHKNIFLAAIVTFVFCFSYRSMRMKLPSSPRNEPLHAIVKSQDIKIDRELLGRSTWNLLHSIASVSQKNSLYRKLLVIGFMVDLSLLYPCQKCAPHFQKYLKNNPPLMENNNSFAMWLCRFHNSVNQRLGKPIFDCTSNSIITPCSSCVKE